MFHFTLFYLRQRSPRFVCLYAELLKKLWMNFRNPRARPHSDPPAILNIERVTSAKLLGIYIQNNFKCDIHFNHIMTVSSQRLQRLHILKVLKRQGLSLKMLHNVFMLLLLVKLFMLFPLGIVS